MASNDADIPITDWSRVGRAAFFQEHRDEILNLVDLAFTDWIDQGNSLAPFGFRGDDPVDDAVAFVQNRFCEGELTEELIDEDCRSTRLFTKVVFWFQQKVGQKGLKACLRRAQQGQRAEQLTPRHAPPPARSDAEAKVLFRQVGRQLAAVLRDLASRTCPDLVGHWLEASQAWRSVLLQTSDSGAPPNPKMSAAWRSKRGADALLRYLILGAALLDPLAQDARAVLEAALFSNADNPPTYRAPDKSIAEQLGLPGSRAAKSLRQQHTTAVLQAAVDLATQPAPFDQPLWRWVAQHSLPLSILEVHGIRDADLKARLRELKEHKSEGGLA